MLETKRCIALLILLQTFNGSFGQQPAIAGWHLLDKAKDGYQGISLQGAYNLLKDKKCNNVIVAVLDGGADTLHEDLAGVLWKNPKEIPGNNKDDDGNGYIDDVKGWNFLGNSNGSNVEKENMEAIRIYHALKSKFEWIGNDTLNYTGSDLEVWNLWKKANNALTISTEDKFNLRLIQATTKAAAAYDTLLQKALQLNEFSLDVLEKYQPISTDGKKAKYSFLRFTQMLEFESDKTNKQIFDELNEYIEEQEMRMYGKEKSFQDYRVLVGDDVKNINDIHYGNPDVMGASALHGTHVGGIIAAVRNNGKGIDGIANQVQLMNVRVVPRGDEYDKDVALGIKYAVNNGAKVINMSFGKNVSPNRSWVEDAIRYAAAKDVLIVHAAGNESTNIDSSDNYPSPFYQNNQVVSNMITVGASGDSSLPGGVLATFTNYGKKAVDVLAPGVKMYSCIPNTNQYAFEEGTSMAAPVVSGIAALLRSYFPQLSAVEVKDILIQSTDNSMADQWFPMPGKSKEKMQLKSTCRSGGIVNAEKAVQLALQLSRQ